ncbi:MAG: DNA-directed DNA polymerase II small subunit [Methanocalculaceae archaeon]|nr:DNA-directed DNA polymerase II small subunit [Methanocalculaceae archaeon]
MQKNEIVARFLEAGLLVHPAVVTYISESSGSGTIEGIISSLPSAVSVVTPKVVQGMAVSWFDKLAIGVSLMPEILSGKKGSSVPTANPEESFALFRDRYDALAAMMRPRVNPVPIEALVRQSNQFSGTDIGAIGMVVESLASAKGHRIVEIEDPTGTIKVLFNKNREEFDEVEKILPDEVIGVRGKLAGGIGGGGGMIFSEVLFRPEIPLTHTISPSKEPGKTALISDVHVGSDTFLLAAWSRFASWLEETPEIKYLLIAGDVVDGIGVYPNQDKELHIKTIYEQYDAVGEMLSALPSHLQIVLSPGNHDAVRAAEPQPVLPEEFCTKFPSNVTFVENPAIVSLQSVNVLMYHGRSIDDMIKFLPGTSYDHPGEIMEEMLKRRHLGPIYGQRTPLLSTPTDHLVIRNVPDILLTGHVHVSAVITYRGVLGVNAGTWQSQTSFQKQMNITPTPAEVVVVDMQTMEYEKFCFLGKKET